MPSLPDIMAELDPQTQTFSGSDGVATTSVHLFSPGTQLGNRYELRRVIDTGGYAVVYVAHDRELRRDIALKVLREDRVSEEALIRFRREVAIARDASSPRLVRVFDIETSDGAVYLTMEWVDGESLKTRLQKAPLSIDEVVRISTGIAEGLQALHRYNVVHRDVKPGNVLLDREDHVKLGDFGLARQVDADDASATATGAIVGTLAYLSPEQALGKDVDHRSDLYSLGVVIFEMLTGKTPFGSESALGALLARMKAPPPDVRSLRRDCPRWLARLVSRLLERRPADRYGSAEAVLRDLRSRRSGPVSRRLRRVAIVAAAAVVILVAGIVAARTWQDRNAFHHIVSSNDGVITAVSRSGNALWKLRGYDPEISRIYALLERGHGGRREVALVLRATEDVRTEITHTLTFLDAETGRVRKRVRLPDNMRSFRQYPRKFAPGSIVAIDLDDDGGEEVIVNYIHWPECPSYSVLYEPRLNRSRVVFVATGHHHVVAAADVDDDGRKDLLLQGIHNGYGWYNVIAAVKIHPPVGTLESGEVTAASPDLLELTQDRLLLWYAYLPHGHQSGGSTISVEDHRVRLNYPDGRHVELGLDGLPLGADKRAARAAARKDAFTRLGAAERLSLTGSHDAALRESAIALESARNCGNELLIEAVQLRRGRFLVRAGRIQEAERHFEDLMLKSNRPADVAMEAAENFHLAGDVSRALQLYRRALSHADLNGLGRSRHELLEGFVLAAAELGRWDEAGAETLRFLDTYRITFSDTINYYREFTRWRLGRGKPDVSNIPVTAFTIDIVHYWQLEFAYSRGEAPANLLRRIDPLLEERSPTRSALLSLHAELLHRMGRDAEARAVITRAWNLANFDVSQTTIARGHLLLVRERYARIAGES